ncbi:MAG: FAD-dependent oxidoreductase, partial [Emcibacteraceae bacterium]|nr:FAD-dependent oxidoreductase [Emcibacteraceae bacterium]
MKITIVGAGIIGTTSAYYLSKAGHDVTVIDRQNGPGLETSFANAGMLTPSMSDPWNSPGIIKTLIGTIGDPHSAFLLRLKALPSLIGWGLSFLNNSREKKYNKNLHRCADMACYSLKLMNDIRENLNLNYDQITTGSLKIFRNHESLQKLAKLSTNLKDHDMRFEVLYGDDLVNREPSLAPIIGELAGGVYFPDDQAGNAYKFTFEIENEAKKLGAKFRYGVEVDKLIERHGKITALRTNDGDVKSDSFILCAGSFTTPLAKSVGVNVPVRPAKGYSITVPLNGWNNGP